jgi:hypothetical protein
LDFYTTKNITWSAWIYREGNTDWDVIIRKIDWTNYGIRVFLSTGGYVRIGNHDNTYVESITTIDLYTWYHIVMIFNSSTPTVPEMYINGERETTTGSATYISDTASSFYIGQGPSTEPFNGIIDEVRTSNILRSADWIAAQYKSMSNTFITFGDEQEDSPGKAYIFHGGSSMDTTSDVNLTGESDGDRFGYSVDYAGDFDGDTAPDVIVGIPYWDNGATTNCGQILVFKGGSSMDTTSDYIHNGTQADGHFGWSVSFALCMNGGSNMVVAGAPHHDTGIETDSGRAEILVIPEYQNILIPIFMMLILVAVWRKKRTQIKGSHQQKLKKGN